MLAGMASIAAVRRTIFRMSSLPYGEGCQSIIWVP
jgi:hypothetical protein